MITTENNKYIRVARSSQDLAHFNHLSRNMNDTIKSLAKRADKSVEDVEEVWNAVKEKAAKKFEKENDEFWAYVNRTVQFKLGLANKKTSFKDFAKKDKK